MGTPLTDASTTSLKISTSVNTSMAIAMTCVDTGTKQKRETAMKTMTYRLQL